MQQKLRIKAASRLSLAMFTLLSLGTFVESQFFVISCLFSASKEWKLGAS